jgi:FkbM family methyltransferase
MLANNFGLRERAFLLRFILVVCARFIKSKLGNKLHGLLLEFLLMIRGYNNCCDMVTTGESELVRRISLSSPKLCIDVGANVGSYSRALLLASDTKVVAFEPLPAAFKQTEELQLEFPERIVAFNVALGDKPGKAELYFGGETSELASLSTEINEIEYVGASNDSSIEVMVQTLDFYIDTFRKTSDEIDFLKIDVEGFEFEVLKGAERILREMKPRVVQIEFNRHQLFRGHSLWSISKSLVGYRCYQLLPGNGGMLEISPADPFANIFLYSNWVFVRDGFELP